MMIIAVLALWSCKFITGPEMEDYVDEKVETVQTEQIMTMVVTNTTQYTNGNATVKSVILYPPYPASNVNGIYYTANNYLLLPVTPIYIANSFFSSSSKISFISSS